MYNGLCLVLKYSQNELKSGFKEKIVRYTVHKTTSYQALQPDSFGFHRFN